MNRVVLIGRLTKDPEVRYSQGKDPVAVARYTLAVEKRYSRDLEQTADFIPCVTFGKAAEFAARYLARGMRIAVEGRIATGSYVNKSGQKVYTVEVVAESHEFADARRAKAQEADKSEAPEYTAAKEPARTDNAGENAGAGAEQRPAEGPAEGQKESPPAAGEPVSEEEFMKIADNVDDDGLPFN